MAATVNQSFGGAAARLEMRVNRVELPWTSDGSGNATATSPALNGCVTEVRLKPGTGTTQPTNGYGATCLNADGVDIFAGLATGLSNATTKTLKPAVTMTDGTNPTSCPFMLDESVTLSITGAGASKTGLVVLLTR